MRNYEVTFIIDPVLSGDEIKQTADTYIDHLKAEGCNIVHIGNTGLRQLAYTIKKRNSGVYYTVEFSCETGTLIDKMELALRRDERIIRFLTVSLDKFGVKYNDDKRKGLIGRKKEEPKDAEESAEETKKAPKAEVKKPEVEVKKPEVETEAKQAEVETSDSTNEKSEG